MMICEKCWVSGKVQGVWYRGSTQHQAFSLGLVGYARNLIDGRVEVLVCGPEASVQQLKDWLWQGPQLAQVSSVDCQEQILSDIPDDFTIG